MSRNAILRRLAVLGVAGIGSAGCLHQPPLPSIDDRAMVVDAIAEFRQVWLSPARIAPPTIPFDPIPLTRGPWRAIATPIRVEDAAWNQWKDGEFRLFNNRVGLAFEITVEGPSPMTWIADQTVLRVDGDAELTVAAATADELLLPLVAAALDQERFVGDGDLVARTRAAGGFRGTYLPVAAVDSLRGVVIFPLDNPERHVAGCTLDLVVVNRGEAQLFTWRFD